MVQKQEKYALTITLKPRFYCYTQESQYFYFRREIQYHMKERKVLDYFFTPELTQNMNIHFHGWIKAYPNQLHKLYKQLSADIGHTIYKICTRKWTNYMLKTQNEMKEYLCMARVSFDQNDQQKDLQIKRKLEAHVRKTPSPDMTEEEKKIDFIEEDDDHPMSLWQQQQIESDQDFSDRSQPL